MVNVVEPGWLSTVIVPRLPRLCRGGLGRREVGSSRRVLLRSESVIGAKGDVTSRRGLAGRGGSPHLGIRMVNVVEPGWLSTVIVPPCAATRECTTAKPRPLPPLTRVRESSTR
ncbi:hypothetical protein SUDANB95_06600 [Actinosynnema sp. ALI-1.44]